jgi:CheY-like chemotaxis protein
LAQRDASGELVFEVVDTGIGVSKEQQKVLFCAFQQGDRSIARRFGGTGLGLTISRALARLLDGTISIKSKVSVGSTFSLCLPAGELENLELIYWQESSGQSTQEVLSNEPSQVLPYRLLLAEDNAVNQLVVTRILEKAGATVDTVSNGVEAMERVIEAAEQGVPYDAVLMDLSMPQMDGLTATRNLREGGMSLPIIALTADARPSTGTECMEAGCNGYTIKPVNREQLFDLLVDQIRGGSACRSPVAED